MKNPKNVRRGRRARQRGAELQRQAVRMAKDSGLDAYNRDRGGAQHEQGVVVREDRGKPYIVLDYEYFINLLSIMKELAKNESR